ncbi:Uncharacterized conserved protein YciI, contains a putative active-site phosphohistidine [Actinopolyspora lacussalsi subsp. righensis]|uniref:Uncharacterized conserved protein YciI, contains a putative active-site phosphohistidine n=1 Tax=Actinopolyspora righensis TaxID=995060 RepID=A0A1I7AKD6_9ACTN|nr:antibiotic biosynthesis monooxygenase [Actinopolyspora righensis]SFT75334.1 Uncharacterized conserved protein YciI, contains a putative active-site phosphohistidine [Actinopolyspora righensis]
MIHVLRLSITASDELVARHLEAHREWVRRNCDAGLILLAGPAVNGGGTVVTADLSDEGVRRLIEDDPWHQHDVATYEWTSFDGRYASPGVITATGMNEQVLLINVATTDDAEESVEALAKTVDHVSHAPGFQGSRLLTSLDGDAIVNFAMWSSKPHFDAIFDDPEFRRRYGVFAETTNHAKFRLYRTSRIISPRN